ncbi:MAG TPA: hypothetical protein ACFYD1_00590 [Candidatus Hypogeohydataceae bacterium YC38]
MMEAVKFFNVTLPYSLYEKLDFFCRTERFHKAHIVRTAIERELERREKRLQKEAKN